MDGRNNRLLDSDELTTQVAGGQTFNIENELMKELCVYGDVEGPWDQLCMK